LEFLMSRSKQIRILAALGTLSGAAWAGTFASFTDDASSTATFSAGTVDLVVGGDSDDAHDFASLSVTNMKPGDVTYAPLSVANTGSLGFSYALTGATTDTADTPAGLGAALRVAVKSVGTSTTCDAAAFTASADQVAASSAFSSVSTSDRSVASEASETLCFQVSFPTDSGNALQGAATTATLSFTATQA